MSPAICNGTGATSCVSPRERDKARCERYLREAGTDRMGREGRIWSLALDLHAGYAYARKEVAERFDVLGGYLLLRGGTDFLKACRAAVAEERWGALVAEIERLETDLVRDGSLRRRVYTDGTERVEPVTKGDYRIPAWIDAGGPLFSEAT